MTKIEQHVRVGIGIIILRNNKVLLGKRKNSHGHHTWSPPGGHLEFGETFEECGKREVFEETNLVINNFQIAAITNDIFDKEKKHYVTIFLITESKEGEVINKEPDKCEEWQWFKWQQLPQPLFLPIKNLINQNYNPELIP